MRKYKSIIFEAKAVPHTTIKGLKLAIKHGKLKQGEYLCVTPCGNYHKWEIKSSGTHVCSGKTVRKSKIGKGSNVINYAATFKGVQ